MNNIVTNYSGGSGHGKNNRRIQDAHVVVYDG